MWKMHTTTPLSTCVLRRLPGSATTDGIFYEIKLAALLALRARREGLTFCLYSNVAAARPWDDLILRVEAPMPVTYFIQLKHGRRGGSVDTMTFVDGRDNDYCLWKYYKWFRSFHEKHLRRESLSDQDERLLCSWALEDARFIMYTNREVEQMTTSEANSPCDFPFEDMLNTGIADNIFSFRKGDEVWKLCEENLFREKFLPRLRIYASQAHVAKLEGLMRKEVNSIYGKPLKRAEMYVKQYIEKIKHWAEDSSEGSCITESSRQLEEVMAEDLRVRARAVAEDGTFAFQEGHCIALRDTLKDRTGTLRVSVSGVPSGHRVAKLQQVLDADFPDKWAYVDDKILREFPLEALKDACSLCDVVVLDVERLTKPPKKLVEMIAERVKLVVLVLDSDISYKTLQTRRPYFEMTEQWTLEQLIPEAQELMLEKSLDYQGTDLQLRDLQDAWPSLCKDVDGTLFSNLVLGRAAIGQMPPEDHSKGHYMARTITHISMLRRNVLRLNLHSEHLVLVNFPRDEIERLDREMTEKEQAECKIWKMDRSLHEKPTVLYAEEEPSESTIQQVFSETCSRYPEHNIHMIENANGVLLWKASRGSCEAVWTFVQPISDSCSSPYQPLCRHEQSTEEDSPAWSGRVYLMLGEPGIGKSSFLQQLAAQRRAQAPRQWTVLVKLLAHGNLLKAMPASKDLKVGNVVDLIAAAAAAAAAEDVATRRSVEAALLHSGAIHVYVDGVDEVVPAYNDKVLRLIELLIKKTRALQIWVASRPEMECSLRSLLHCTSLSLLHFSRSQQLSYVTAKWTFDEAGHPLHAVENLARELVEAFECITGQSNDGTDTSEIFQNVPSIMIKELVDSLNNDSDTQIVLTIREMTSLERKAHNAFSRVQNTGESNLRLVEKTMKEFQDTLDTDVNEKRLFIIIDKNGRNIVKKIVDTLHADVSRSSLLSVPLHLSMAAEVFVNNALSALSSNGSLLRGRVGQLNIFRRFIDKKHEHFRERYKIEGTAEKKVFHSLHMNYAMLLWTASLPQYFQLPFKEASNDYKEYLSQEKTGILRNMENGQPQFAHYVFLEYFVGTWLFENIHKPDTVEKYLHEALNLQCRVLPFGLTSKSSSMVFFFLDLMLTEGFELHNAVLTGDIDALQTALTSGKGIDTLDRGGRSALHLAAFYGRHEALNKLLAKNFDLNQQDSLFQWTPLQYADKHLEMRSAEMLLKKGADASQLFFIIKAANADPSFIMKAAQWDLEEIFQNMLKILPHKIITVYQIEDNLKMSSKKGRERQNHGKSATSNDDSPIYIETPINVASLNNSMHVAKLLLNIKANVNPTIHRVVTPLHLASSRGHISMVQLLLSYGADVNTTATDGNTPLHYAAMGGHERVVKHLLKTGANIHSPGKDEFTPLLCASRGGHCRVVQILLSRGANVNMTATNGMTAIHLAACFGHEQVIEILTRAGANIHSCDQMLVTPLHLACMKGHVTVVKSLLSHGADLNKTMTLGNLSIHLAARMGHEPIVKLLLSRGANINSVDDENFTPLHYASQFGHASLVQLLLSLGADIHRKSNVKTSPLHVAADCGHKCVAEILLNAGANLHELSNDKYTPLHCAAEEGQATVVKFLLSRGADLNRTTIFGFMPIHAAARKGHEQVIDILLDAGASIHSLGGDDFTPLHYAAQGGYAKLVKYLVLKGSDINSSAMGLTPLLLAVMGNHSKVVVVLLSHGVDVNKPEYRGLSPLHYAAYKGYTAILKLLLSRGANIHQYEENGKIPIEMAIWQKHADIVEILSKAESCVKY